MIVDVYTVCYNEIKIAPFVVQYWERYARKVYVYDNGSDDGSIEYLSTFSFIEIRHFDSDGLNDKINMDLKNSVWKESRGSADFVVVCDFDECLYAKDIMGEFEKLKENDVAVCMPAEYVMMGDSFPVYDENVLSHEQIGYGYKGNSKCLVFDPNKIVEINYSPGCHICHPVGSGKFCKDSGIFFLHHAEICKEYALEKYRNRRKRLSKENIEKRYGTFYLKSDDEVIKEMEYKRNNLCVPLDSVICEKTLKIFVCTYDKPVHIYNDVFVPLQVGRAVSSVKLDCLGDDTGDNISNKNKYYSEQTGVYWVWKNMKDNHPDYVGFCHYRKYPYMNTGIHQQEIKCTEDFFNRTGGMNIQKIRELVSDNDVLCINPFGYRVSLRSMYGLIHIVEDIDILSETVKDMFPEYNEVFDKTINTAPSFLYPYNIYVMKWDDFCRYCEFIFPLFEEMENKIDFGKHNGYQSRVFGYMAERLLNVFILKNFKSISTVPCAVIDDYEDPDYTVQDK